MLFTVMPTSLVWTVFLPVGYIPRNETAGWHGDCLGPEELPGHFPQWLQRRLCLLYTLLNMLPVFHYSHTSGWKVVFHCRLDL